MVNNEEKTHSDSETPEKASPKPAKTDSGASERPKPVVHSRRGTPSRFFAAIKWIVLCGTLGAALYGLRGHTFRAPISHDEAIFIYAGQAWADGQTPYRDFWDHKPPHVFLFHSLPLRFFPFSRNAVLIHELLWLALAATLFAAVCRLHLSRGATLVALPFLCLFVSSRITIGTGGLTEESSLAFVALSYLMILRPSARVLRDAFLAGLFLGIAAEFRQTYAPSVLFLGLATLWRSRTASLGARDMFGAVVLCGLGFALPELLWSAYFAIKGVWWEYIEASYLFNVFYIGAEVERNGGFVDGLREHWRVLLDTGPVLAAPVLALALAPWLPRERRWLLALALVAFVCEFAPISISGEYYHHYYVQATVSSCLLLALAAQALGAIVASPFRRSRDRSIRGARLAAGILVGLAVVAATAWLTDGGVRKYRDRYRALIRRNYGEKAKGGPLATERSLAKAIQQLTEPDERILLLGVQPNACYFAAKRHAGARYFHNAPLFKGKFQSNISPEMQARMMDDLKERTPVLVILGLLEGEKSERGMGIFDERPGAAFLRPYLEENYVAFDQVVSEIPIPWFWYRKKCTFLVRKDLVETIKKRFEASKTNE